MVRAHTSAASAMAGTALGDTNETASILETPASARASISEARARTGSGFSAWSPSRGPTSRMVTRVGSSRSVGDEPTGVSPTLPLRVALVVERGDPFSPILRGDGPAPGQVLQLDADPEELIDHAARPEVAYGHKSSMLQDVEARRQTEIDYLNGGIVRFGRAHAVPTPLHAAIWALVKGLEASWET